MPKDIRGKRKKYKQFQFKRIDVFTSEIVCDKCEHGLAGKCVPNMEQPACDVYIYMEDRNMEKKNYREHIIDMIYPYCKKAGIRVAKEVVDDIILVYFKPKIRMIERKYSIKLEGT